MSIASNFFLILTIGFCNTNIFSLTSGQNLPASPCPNVFQYYQESNGEIHGRITLPYDGSTTLKLGVNASMIGYYTDKNKVNIKIKMITPSEDLIMKRTSSVIYTLTFPFQHTIPKITNIDLNQKVYCTGPPEKLGQEVPSSPCPDVFQYNEESNGNVYGTITIPYDGTTTLVVAVNASMKGYYNSGVSLQIKMDTPSQDLIYQRAKTLRYSVYFPFQHTIPKITQIKLNGKGYCSGPPEEVIPGTPGVTSLWSEHRFYFQTSKRNSGFQPSTSQNPFEDIGHPVTQSQRFPEIVFTFPPPNQQVDNTKKPTSSDRIQGCGLVKNTFVPLILGGNDISDGMFPWLAAMLVSKGTGYDYKCTANLISEKHVITAARCIFYYKLQVVQTKHILFVFGKKNLQNWATTGAVARGAMKIDAYPDFNQVSGHGDISLVTLDRPVEYSDTISPICLWTENDDFENIVGQTGTVAGWGADEGALKADQYSVSEAKSLQMPVVSNDECLNSNLTYYSLTSDMTFCAGQRNGKGTCVGDNGAPFMIFKNGKYYIRGLASLTLNGSDGKCDLTYFMIFCDVAKFTDWIKSSMKK